ncbi:MAG: hypothetical protein CR988_00145 [Treponema sp.]|nr:MAG: hypothetical protein CR988_00145 [Treponema sp.]
MRGSRILPSKTIFLYIFKEILLYCGIAFLFFFVIFFVNNILAEIREDLIKNVSLGLILKFMFYSIPIVIANAAPYSALIGTLMCFGRFTSDYEILSMNALGLSSRIILVPTLLAAIFISLLSFFVNDILIPISALKLNKIQIEMMTATPTVDMESYSIKRSKNMVMVTGAVDENVINDLLIIDDSDNESIRFISAGKSLLKSGNGKGILMSIDFEDPILLRINKNDKKDYEFSHGEKLTYNILIKEFKQDAMVGIGPGQLSSYDLYNKIKKMKEDPNASLRRLNFYNLEFQKKFVVPFGAFFFILLAYALSTSVKLYNQGVGFVIGLLISVGYWSVLMGGQQLTVEKNINSFITMWLPNALLLIIAVLLLGKRIWK